MGAAGVAELGVPVATTALSAWKRRFFAGRSPPPNDEKPMAAAMAAVSSAKPSSIVDQKLRQAQCPVRPCVLQSVVCKWPLEYIYLYIFWSSRSKEVAVALQGDAVVHRGSRRVFDYVMTGRGELSVSSRHPLAEYEVLRNVV